MSSVRDKQAMLVNALVKATQKKKIKWNPWGDDGSCYQTEVSGKNIYLSEVQNGGFDSIKVEVYRDSVLADYFLDDDLTVSDVEILGGDSWFQSMSSLLHQIKRQSTGADELLDGLIKDLED